jgi:maltose alpha-D-glucosyltransferase/alpha-amylase
MEGDPLWYKDAIIYEVHVRAFFDSSDDGRGDFRGLASKLDYLQNLGVTAIWLLPFYPSPWRDDGYDVASYTDIHPAYGTMRDFQLLLSEAHARGMKVITELVLNHTSDQHEWFQRSRRAAPGTSWRDYYVWSDTPDKYPGARVIFNDFHSSNWTYDPLAKAYYWHRFFSHQPDLNFDNPLVRRAMLRVVDFWLDKGVDGFRLDAIPYLFEREGTSCENLPETHAFLKELRAHVDKKYADRMFLAEANLWPEDAVTYFGAGDECQMSFHFPLMPRLFAAIRMEDRFPIVEILRQTPAIPDNCQWALFLRNHDELTLEMVTDEERDYLYRTYAQDADTRINLGIRRRLAPLLGSDRRLIELMNNLLFTLPGTPVVYYGDEIGMGDNVYLGDRNGVRTPMQWSSDRNAGFSRANPQKLYLPIIIDPEYHYEAINVEIQQNNSHSLLWWMKRLIALRKKYRALGRGSLEFLTSDNHKVLAFSRRYKDECVIVVANLSRFAQHAAIDLAAFRDSAVVEAFGGNEFAVIRDHPYDVTLAPYACYWLTVQPRVSTESVPGPAADASEIRIRSLEEVFAEESRPVIARILGDWLKTRRWFPRRASKIESIRFQDVIRIGDLHSWIVIVEVSYTEGDAEIFSLFASLATGPQATKIREGHADLTAFHVRAANGDTGVLYSALWDEQFGAAVFETIARKRRLRGDPGELIGSRMHAAEVPAAPTAVQTNGRIAYANDYILKLVRRLEPGTNPEVETTRFLLDKARFPRVPAIVGTLEYRRASGRSITIGVLHKFVAHEASAWRYTLDAAGKYFEQARLHPERDPDRGAFGPYLEMAALLGKRTAEMHIAMAPDTANGGPAVEAFLPQAFTDPYRLSLYHSLLNLLTRSLETLRQRPGRTPDAPEVQLVLAAADEVRQRLRYLRNNRIEAMRTRTHGCYHLGQLLFTGRDFIITDIEGDQQTNFDDRRKKRSPLGDVASMLLSFRRVAAAVRIGGIPGVVADAGNAESLDRWGEFWYSNVSAAFVGAYREAITAGSHLKPGLVPAGEQFDRFLEILDVDAALSAIERISSAGPQEWILPELRMILDAAGARGPASHE